MLRMTCLGSLKRGGCRASVGEQIRDRCLRSVDDRGRILVCGDQFRRGFGVGPRQSCVHLPIEFSQELDNQRLRLRQSRFANRASIVFGTTTRRLSDTPSVERMANRRSPPDGAVDSSLGLDSGMQLLVQSGASSNAGALATRLPGK